MAASRPVNNARRPHQIPRVTAPFENDGRTRQSFADECDINRIVDTYARTGIVNHLPRGAPQYGDNPEQSLFEAAIIQAEIRSSEEDEVLNPPSDALSVPESDETPESGTTPEGEAPEPDTAPQAASDAES